MVTRTSAPFLPTVPQVSTPFVDTGLLITPAWHQLLIKLYQNVIPGTEQDLVTGPSPFTYNAQVSGTLIVQGLTGHVTLARPPVATAYTVFAGVNGTVPLAAGDIATITYTSTPPTLIWFPG